MEHYFIDELIAVDPILAYFDFEHLPNHLQEVSASFAELAGVIIDVCPRNPERRLLLPTYRV